MYRKVFTDWRPYPRRSLTFNSQGNILITVDANIGKASVSVGSHSIYILPTESAPIVTKITENNPIIRWKLLKVIFGNWVSVRTHKKYLSPKIAMVRLLVHQNGLKKTNKPEAELT